MESWKDFSIRRDRITPSIWWREENILFSHKFRFPFDCRSIFIVVPASRSLKFAREKVERLAHMQENARIYLLVEDPDYNRDVMELASQRDNLTAVIVPFPVSESAERAVREKKLPAKSDCSIVLSPHYEYDDMAYIRLLPLCSAMRKLSKRTLTLDNRNYLSEENDPLEETHEVRGKTLYGYASLTHEDMDLMYEYAGRAGGGVLVEIGRYLGGSTNIIAQSIKDSEKPSRFFSFDHILPEVVPNIIKKNGLSEYLSLHVMTSEEGFNNWGQIGDGAQIDFLFIDADHSYESIMNDFSMWLPLLRNGGTVMVHDFCNLFYNGLEDIDVAVYKNLMNGGFEILDSCFTSIVCKKK